MKKNKIIWLAIAMFALSALIVGCKVDNTNAPLAYAQNSDGTLTVTGLGKCTNPNIVIPSEYNNKAVTAIAENAFQDSSIISLEINAHVTSIGQGIVSGCDSLTALTVPFLGSTATDEQNAYVGFFFGTAKGKTASRSLENFTILSATKLGDYAISGLRALKSFVVPDGVTYIGTSCFEGCSSLTSLTGLSDQITYIGTHAFNTTKITSLNLPCAADALSLDCLYGMNCLEELTINLSQNNLMALYDSRLEADYFAATPNASFANSHSILPTTLTTIHLIGDSVCDYALAGAKISKVTFSDTVETIGSAAFVACHSLKEIALPDSILTIKDYAFMRNTKLEKVTCGINLKTIGENAFNHCQALTTIDFSQCLALTDIQSQAFQACTSLTQIEFPASLQRIEMCAFQDCEKLTDITIPAAVSHIGVQAFDGCKALKSIAFVQKSNWKTVNGYAKPDLSDAAANVKLFTETYVIYYWYRK